MPRLTYSRPRLSSAQRQAIYDRCCDDSESGLPICNLCGLPVDGSHEAWDVSHDPEGPPSALGGTDVGIAHRLCNIRHGASVVRPMLARCERVRRRALGATIARHPLPAGRETGVKMRIGGGLAPRLTLAERTAASSKIIPRRAADAASPSPASVDAIPEETRP